MIKEAVMKVIKNLLKDREISIPWKQVILTNLVIYLTVQ